MKRSTDRILTTHAGSLPRPDDLRTLGTGEAYIWTTLGPAPQRVQVDQAVLPDHPNAPVGADASAADRAEVMQMVDSIRIDPA